MTEQEVVGMMILLSVAIGALLWQWYEDARRDLICQECRHCQRKLHGDPPPPPPRSGVGL